MSATEERHGELPRGLDAVPRSSSYQGRFGRLFRQLDPVEHDDGALEALADTMIEVEGDRREQDLPSNNPDLPAGYTYFGQFIDHDLTFDPASRLQRQNDPDAITNFRTPRFDLDSVYGGGPSTTPFLYDASDSKPEGTLLIGRNEAGQEDLPRNSDQRALIADPRNDENLIVSQLHLIFLKFHNKVLSQVHSFNEARRIVCWHYQWLVLRDFLPRLIQQAVADLLLKVVEHVNGPELWRPAAIAWDPSLRFFKWKRDLFMPVEFSAAAYRFGHSMVRQRYTLQAFDDAPRIFHGTLPDLRGRKALPPKRRIEWPRFFPMPRAPEAFRPEGLLQTARAIDTLLATGLGDIPAAALPTSSRFATLGAKPRSLAAINLHRGKALGLPSGQAVARAMGIPPRLTLGDRQNGEVNLSIGPRYPYRAGFDSTVPLVSGAMKGWLEEQFRSKTPLWYYILKEAEIFANGKYLGPVGGRIVGEVFVGLLTGDRHTFINVQPGWIPKRGCFGCSIDGTYAMADMLAYAQA